MDTEQVHKLNTKLQNLKFHVNNFSYFKTSSLLF